MCPSPPVLTLAIPLFIITRALGKATTFSLGWATSLFFGQIPGGKERVVSMLSAVALAWLLIAYVGGGISAVVLLLHAAGHSPAGEDVLDRVQSVVLGILLLPPLLTYIGQKAELTGEFSWRRWIVTLPLSYPIAISLGGSVALMLVIGPIVLSRRRRAGLRTHHIPVLVPKGKFSALVDDVMEELADQTGAKPVVGTLAGLWALPMRTMTFAGQRLFGSVIRERPVIIVAGKIEVTAHATDVNVTAPLKDSYPLRSAFYKRLALSKMYLTWSADTQAFEERLWKVHADSGATLTERRQRLDRLEHDIDRAAIGTDEWNVLYRIVLQLREQLGEGRRERSA